MLAEKLVLIEDLTLDLTFRLKELATWLTSPTQGRSAPDFHHLMECHGAEIIDDARLNDLLGQTATPNTFGGSAFRWPLGALPAWNEHVTNPLTGMFQLVAKFDSIKFGVLYSNFTSDDRTKFKMRTKLAAKASMDQGTGESVVGVSGKQDLSWELQGGVWNLVGWKSIELKVIISQSALFEDITEKCLPDKDTLNQAQRSRHFELITETVQTGVMPELGRYTPFIDAASPHALPSVTVVDFDNDEDDDLFISGRWTPTQLLQNQGDGTFKDVAEERGVSFPNVVNCSAFVDLDNDGDKDAIIGRSLEPIVYLRNDGGKYVDVTAELSNLGDQFMVAAISVADINRDGLLDLYLSTYGPFGQNEPRRVSSAIDWRKDFLKPHQARKLTRKHAQGNVFVDNAGPPNLLVLNRGGGRLELIEGNELTQQWHHTYQTAWGDVDGDGDDDLYIANDFSEDGFLINETKPGDKEPVFANGIETHFAGGMAGFGMGTSWGDYDSDGDLDLYVSNMYSKAGTRILKHVGEGDPRIEVATRGNFLFQNSDGLLKNVAGTGSGQQNVGRVGWSYGGQFVDLDNNGFLDLYVPSGYFTALAEADTKVDI